MKQVNILLSFYYHFTIKSMYKDCTIKYIGDTLAKLLEAKISIYKISKILDEPEPTMQNIFNKRAKYSEERVIDIMDRINSHIKKRKMIDLALKRHSDKKLVDAWDCDFDTEEFDTPQDPDLFIKLYALGLDSKAFTPDEKYKLAVAYKKLTDSKNKIKNNE